MNIHLEFESDRPSVLIETFCHSEEKTEPPNRKNSIVLNILPLKLNFRSYVSENNYPFEVQCSEDFVFNTIQ